MYSEELISRLRDRIPAFLSGKRLAHTYAVEEECRSLSAVFSAHPQLFSEEDGLRLRTAALIHDITKEKTPKEQLLLCSVYNIPLTDYEKASPKVLHAKTAPAFAADVFNREFGERIIDDMIADAVYTHTTGAARMSLAGKLLYLADYIEPTRTFPDCIALRSAFYEKLPAVQKDPAALLLHLDRVLLSSFDMTLRDLIENGAFIDTNTTAARNALLFAHSDTAHTPS